MLHSQAPGFLDTLGRGAPLRFLHPRVTDVRPGFLTHLICNIFGSGGNLPYSPGTGKTWLHINVQSLISRAPEESRILLPPGLGEWRRLLVPSVCRPTGARASYPFAGCHGSSSPGSPRLRSAPTSLPHSFLRAPASFRTSFQIH